MTLSVWLSLAALVVALAAVPLMVWQKRARDPDRAREVDYAHAESDLRDNECRLSLLALDYHLTRLHRTRPDAVGASSELGLLTLPAWIPDAPLTIDDPSFQLKFSGRARSYEGDFDHVLPPYRRERSRLSEIMKRDRRESALFFSNPTYLVDAVTTREGALTIDFSVGDYFAFIDSGRALSLEFALAHARARGRLALASRYLRVRAQIKDPFAFEEFPHFAAVSTVTIRRCPPNTTFYIIKRGDAVAMSSGITGVVPGGMFQPNSVHPEAARSDLDLLRTLQREFGEELLGFRETAHAKPRKVVYDSESPYVDLDFLRHEGHVEFYFLGFGINPLTMAAEFLTAAVFDEDAFALLGLDGFTETSDEGVVPTTAGWHGLPFPDAIDGVLADEPVGASARACLTLARRHATMLTETDD